MRECDKEATVKALDKRSISIEIPEDVKLGKIHLKPTVTMAELFKFLSSEENIAAGIVVANDDEETQT